MRLIVRCCVLTINNVESRGGQKVEERFTCFGQVGPHGVTCFGLFLLPFGRPLPTPGFLIFFDVKLGGFAAAGLIPRAWLNLEMICAFSSEE